MSTRPTPEEIARSGSPEYVNPRLDLLAHLRGLGYVVVHPADVPEKDYGGPVDDGYIAGWNDCRRQIFGEGV